MTKRVSFLAIVCAAAFAGCGGGGSTLGGGGGGGGGGVTPGTAGNLPLSESVGGGSAWVNPSSHKTLYQLSNDTATGAKCTAGCLSIWPAFTPATGSTNTDNMTIVTRGDGTGQQWAYQGIPLYNYSGDTGPDQANGEGVTEADGGVWHVARPAASASATPPPGDPGCHGYC